jgi:GT2 family glycosyltransferase
MTLALPEGERPELSVVMITHGAWEHTERAVRALAEHTYRPFELIVVDNASQDPTRGELSRLRGARVVLNDENRGFGPANNQGAKQARGEFLVLLNTDVFVHPGWLEPLLEALRRPGVGAAVPRYVHEDGSLQEAGVLLGRDGTVCFHGDGDDPDKPCYRFRRTVDYGSAACMVIRRRTFTALGGFDDLFAPAYYEDSDMCMRLAQSGLTVAYEPRSTVTHLRHGSGSFDAALTLSEQHRQLFVGRWGSNLIGRPASFARASDQAAIAARDALATPRVLICAQPGERGASELLHALLDGWPRARLTWAVQAPGGRRPPRAAFDRDRWLGLGVEVLDQDELSCLDRRLFHYDLAVCGRPTARALVEALDRTQPQASRISLEELADPPSSLPSRLVAILAAAGIAPEDREPVAS